MFDSQDPQGNDGLPWGWFDKGDIRTYRELYDSLPNGAVTAEIGVWQGRSICSVADIILRKNLKVYAIDTFKGSPSAIDVVHDCKGKLKDIFNENISKFRLGNNVVIIEDDSISAAKKINQFFNLVFIDSNHSPSSVESDISFWLPLVKKRGVLSGHDYDWVKDIVHRELEKKGFKIITDNRNIYWIRT